MKRYKKGPLSVAIFLGIALGVTVALLLVPSPAAAQSNVRFERVFPDLPRFERPVFMLQPPDGGEYLYIVEQAGRIYRFPHDQSASARELVLNIVDKVQAYNDRAQGGGNEEGLLGMAFHPRFADNSQLYLYYSAGNPRRSVLSMFKMNPARDAIDVASEEVILEVRQPWGNHNGGMIAFGPDGYLYISLGDGGSGGDPKNNGQDLSTLLGSILRIDVDQQANGKNYAIPPDNPFIDEPDARDEIFAYGLRNVWRFSFDRKTGDLWAGDVGQNKWEEIDLITKGGNYGWRFFEGKHDFRNSFKAPMDVIFPIVEHDRREAMSITGGYVYRGPSYPDLQGAYFYGDYVRGNLWLLRYDDGEVTEHKRIDQERGIASFAEDHAGELYLLSFDGHIYRLTTTQ